jgi:hypothetical protein
MSTDNIEPDKKPTEVPPKDAKTELSEEELAKVSAGAGTTFNYGTVQVKYQEQKSDG